MIFQHQFPNGLTLLAESMPLVQSAAFTFLVPAGSIHDADEYLGTAAVLAEWITRGAGDRSGRELLAALDYLGVSHGESAHLAHLSMSAATLGRNLQAALDLFADVALRPRLDDEEIEPIRALLLQSLRSLEDDPASKVMVELRRRHYPDPWGRLPQGSTEGLQSLSPEVVRRFHTRRFRPNEAILAVAGAIDWPILLGVVGRLFGDWRAQPEAAISLRRAGPPRDHVLKETQQTQIAAAIPSVAVSHPDYYQARAAAGILGGYSSSRLFTEVREKQGLCYTVYAAYESFLDRASLVCHAGTAPERAQQTLDVLLAELRRLKRSGVVQEELDTMRAGLKSSLIMQQESSTSRSSALASDWYFLKRIRSIDEIAAALDGLTPSGVSAFCAEIPLDSMTLVTLGPVALQLDA